MTLRIAVLFAALAVGSPAVAQAFNVNFSARGVGPSASYGAAGLEGAWNTVPGTWGVQYPLRGLDGSATNVRVRNLGGSATPSADHPATTGDDELLLDSYLATFNGVETCLRFSNLVNGTYQAITYAWFNPNPAVVARVTCDESSDGPRIIGGAWPGAPEIGRVFAVHIANVTNGVLNVHSGLFAGNTVAALNGIQIRRLTAADGVVGLTQGGPFDVLEIDGRRGGELHQVAVPVGLPFAIDVLQPPTSLVPAHYVLLGCLDVPTALDATPLLNGMGTLAFPPWFLALHDNRLFTLGASFLPDLWLPAFTTAAAPVTITLPAGLPAFRFTLQPLIEQAPGEFRVGNQITCSIQ